MTVREIGWLLFGLGVGLGGAAAVSMLTTGYRVDEEGTGTWPPETAIQLAGAAIALVLFTIGFVIVVRRRRVEPERV
ncbi:hypothetical protein [Mumia sp. DW29H23]|uniref:hypothetical protein n=1 Tax=Mumia sp. DW29H23 TaxID=3421241 RepID=UPI003D69E906